MLAAFIIGVVAGLRAMVPLAAVSWAARLGILDLGGTWLGFMGYKWSPWIFSLLALAEIINDKFPKTPSRKTPPQFATRVLTGAWAGLAIGMSHNAAVVCAVLGAVGAAVGTLGGASARAFLAKRIGRDLPIALLEDCIAVGAAFVVMRIMV